MKKIILVLFSLLIAQIYSQTAVEKMAEESCACIHDKKLDFSNKEKLEMEFGVCMLTSFTKHKVQYNKENKNFTFTEAAFEKIGANIAMEMMNFCPEIIMKIGMMQIEEENATNESVEKISGTITKIEKDLFNVVHFKTEENITQKMIWLWQFVNSDILLDEAKWKGKKITVSYSELEFFDPRIEEYSNFKIIDGIEVE